MTNRLLRVLNFILERPRYPVVFSPIKNIGMSIYWKDEVIINLFYYNGRTQLIVYGLEEEEENLVKSFIHNINNFPLKELILDI